MSKFTVRVELQNATEEDDEKLRVERVAQDSLCNLAVFLVGLESRKSKERDLRYRALRQLAGINERVAQSLCISNSAVLGSGTAEKPQSFRKTKLCATLLRLVTWQNKSRSLQEQGCAPAAGRFSLELQEIFGGHAATSEMGGESAWAGRRKTLAPW